MSEAEKINELEKKIDVLKTIINDILTELSQEATYWCKFDDLQQKLHENWKII